jgi:hypothetical protein
VLHDMLMMLEILINGRSPHYSVIGMLIMKLY